MQKTVLEVKKSYREDSRTYGGTLLDWASANLVFCRLEDGRISVLKNRYGYPGICPSEEQFQKLVQLDLLQEAYSLLGQHVDDCPEGKDGSSDNGCMACRARECRQALKEEIRKIQKDAEIAPFQ